MHPMTFLARLAAQIPPSRVHTVSYYRVLAAAAARREQIVGSSGIRVGSRGSLDLGIKS